MLQVPWLNAYVPQTLHLNDESLDAERQKERPEISLDRESTCFSLPGINERLHWVHGGERILKALLEQPPGEGEGQCQLSL